MIRRSLLLFLLLAPAAWGQSIITVAGGGTVDGQKLTDVLLSGPAGLAFDPAGNLLVSLSGAGQVLRVDAATGLVTTVAGNGAAGFTGDHSLAINASLRQPSGIAADAAGNVYIADRENDRVRRVNASNGIITTVAGGGSPATGIGDGGPATAALLGKPWGILVRGGALYITEIAYNANRVRRVDLTTGIITTIAGTTDGSVGGFAGDGGPATAARLSAPFGIAADAAGNLYVNDRDNSRIRRIDTNGIITTYAGGGPTGNFADGIAATSADLDVSLALAFDRNGNLLLTSTQVGVRRVDKATGTIRTVFADGTLLLGLAVDAANTIYTTDNNGTLQRFRAGASEPERLSGDGAYVGDGLGARAAVLHSPQGLALDRSGNLYIVDSQASLIRRVSASDGTISTVAGVVNHVYASPEQEGTPATESAIGYPTDIAFDAAGLLYIADELNGRIWRVDAAGKLTTFAGGGSPADGIGDGGPATAAAFVPWAISFDRNGNLYVADKDLFATVPHSQVRRIDAATHVITTVAGSSAIGYAGDGGPATQAKLDGPIGVAIDADGNLFIADGNNGAIRRVDHATGIITTFAGHFGESDPLGDGGPAAQARLAPLHLVIDRNTGDLYAPDFSSQRLRKFDRNGTVSTVAGSGFFYLDGGFGGDNGPATAARLSLDYGDVSGVAINAAGDVFFSDSQNNRVRLIVACRSVGAPSLTSPANDATTLTSPKLTWSAVAGAFRYDVMLDTVNPPAKTVATDVDDTSFRPANLEPGTKYYWQVVAKADRYCPAASRATSVVNTFTTASVCRAGAFDLVTPADNGQVTSPVHLTWQASSGASAYDVYLGTTNPPALVATGLTATSYDATVSGAQFWFVVAHASCDSTKTATTQVRRFTASGAGCEGTPSVTATAPANGATSVATTASLTWNAQGPIDGFEVYFGTSSNPPLLRAGLASAARSLALPSLDAGTKYYWSVRAVGACAPQGGVSTAVQSFTTRGDCPTPGASSILFAPATVSADATYAIVWSPAPSLGADGGYLVERSTSSTFGTILDSQVTGSTAASFLAAAPGTLYHRVRAFAACDPTHLGPSSDVKSVTVAPAPPNVVFTVQPQAVVTALGERLEDQRSSFALENLGTTPLQVLVGRQELGGSPPFFSIAGDAAFVTLQPRTPRRFALRFSGPPNDVAASYQGVIFVAATGQSGLAVTPYAFVNLKVGGGNASIPKFLVDGAPSDYVAFPGFSGDDTNRPARQVTLRNDGTAPMELAAEIGPEVWLTPAPGWNATALAPGASRTIDLFTQRNRAPNGSALPRYTYFTVRTKDGASARLLVQDNDAVAVSNGRTAALDVTARSFIVPEVVSTTSARGTKLVTRLRLSNAGGDAVQAELIYTPSGADGFDASLVRRAVIVVPPNDVVTVTDPIVQIFRLSAPGSGQLEVRLPRERVGLVTVRSSIVALGTGGNFDTPVVSRGEGASAGAPHVVHLLPSSVSSLALAETSGNDGATVRVTLFNSEGQQTATTTQTLPRYGMTRMNNLTAARIAIEVEGGGGSVIGLATITSGNGESGATRLSRAAVERAGATSLARASLAYGVPLAAAAVSVTTVVPVLGTGTSAYKTTVGFVAPSTEAATFIATLRIPGGPTAGTVRNVTLTAGTTKVYNDIVTELFGASAGQGSVFVSAPSSAKVYASVNSGVSVTPTSFLTLPTTLSEALTSAGASAQRPLSYDGLEQSTDPTVGDRWLVVLNEVAGSSGAVNVRLYEAGNRTSAIAEGDFSLTAFQQLSLDSIFSTLGLDSPDRRKDRTNVEVVVTATSGNARIAATALAISQTSGEARSFALTPVVGSGTPNVVFAAPVVVPDQPVAPPRRRAVGH
jgi:sugar lactone lactonase YvrE